MAFYMLKVKEVAKLLGISTSKVRRLIEKGQIEALQLKKGGSYRISPEEIGRVKGLMKK